MGYSDAEMLTILPEDPDLERYREFLRNARLAARQDFAGAHVALLEWTTERIAEDNAAMNNEAKNNAAAAAQRKENCRTRYAELDRLYQNLPSRPKEATGAAKPAAAAASKQ